MLIRVLPFALILMILAPWTFAAETTSDTTLVLGGPDCYNGRFENSEGEPDWHGWTHADLYDAPGPHIWHASEHLAIDGQYSAWCGTWFDNNSLDGYGNNWDQSLQFTYPANNPDLPTTVRWQATVVVSCEDGYDYLEVYVGQGYRWTGVGTTMDGELTLDLDLTLTIEPEDYIDGSWRIRFRGLSDGGWSDEDGYYNSHGLARVDNIVITADGSIVETEDFEDGTLGNWVNAGEDGMGDFTALWDNLGDIDPEPSNENSSWQVAFIDDGLVVPETEGSPCSTWCYGPDGWVFNVDASIGILGGSEYQPLGTIHGGVWNAAISPPFAWPDNKDAGEMAFDVYAHMQTYECGLTTYGWTFRTTTDINAEALDAELWQPTRWACYATEEMPMGPGYFRVAMPMNELPAGTKWVQVRLEAYEFGPVCWGEYVTEGTPAPYFDNVAVRAWSQTSGTPDAIADLYLMAQPNPFNPKVAISYSQPEAGPVALVIYDMRGHLIRNLVTGSQPAGANIVHWDGRDSHGQNLATSVYLVRLNTSAGTQVRKLSLVR